MRHRDLYFGLFIRCSLFVDVSLASTLSLIILGEAVLFLWTIVFFFFFLPPCVLRCFLVRFVSDSEPCVFLKIIWRAVFHVSMFGMSKA